MTPPPAPTPASPSRRPAFTERLKAFLEEYGPVGLGVYLLLTAAVFGGAWAALSLGLELGGVGGTAGTFAGAYAVHQLTKLPRFAATLALTPLVARLPPVARVLQRYRDGRSGA